MRSDRIEFAHGREWLSVAQFRATLALLEDGWSPYLLWLRRTAGAARQAVAIVYNAGRYRYVLRNGTALYTVDGGCE